MTKSRNVMATRPIVILGGAGFIGSNLADSYLSEGRDVIVVDNLSRTGVEANLQWLKERYQDRLHVVLGDIRDDVLIRDVLRDAAAVFHLAAQVAVTTSLVDPIEDFSVNAGGTLNILEVIRQGGGRTPIVFSSTNKVYGNLDDLEMTVLGDCYFPADAELRANGISEKRNLAFCTPYGCSKGVADQYVLDYAKSYGLSAAVLRMSCIYGPRQFGTEDQGWVAHFLIRAMRRQPITVYGDGRQVRDILHVTDAVAAYRSVLANIGEIKGQAFNLGGGPVNAVSLRMVLQEIAELAEFELPIGYSDQRTGDQLYFVADTRKLQRSLNWHAGIGWRQGIRDLAAWVKVYCAGSRDTPPAEGERLRA